MKAHGTIDRRRSRRVFLAIPVRLRAVKQDGTPVEESAETVVISWFGALLRMHSLLEKGTLLTVTNSSSKVSEQFRVAWVGTQLPDGRWHIGIEVLNPREDFWGISFPPEKPNDLM